MPTHETIRAAVTGPVRVHLDGHTGLVNVTVDPDAVSATVSIYTQEADGPSTHAVTSTTHRTVTHGCGHILQVGIPAAQHDFSRTISGLNSTSVHNVIGPGVTINGSVIMSGGVITDGRPDAEDGTPIEIEMTLPTGSSLTLTGGGPDLKVEGTLAELNVEATNSSILCGPVGSAVVTIVSGRIDIDEVFTSARLSTVNGPIEVAQYSGHELSASSVNGSLSLTATDRASGRADLTTVNGSITTRKAEHLQITASTVHGSIFRR
ncbi:DUF4097 family beta strand repeat-containing protein [Kitasatospora sp. NPDC048296]|uniref:DUF4097 family beta strand repeat-containing protein n=1 Tax=Kitasatospora sp. NPDC048296 TaxID=3364048 RepID=UPI003722DD03